MASKTKKKTKLTQKRTSPQKKSLKGQNQPPSKNKKAISGRSIPNISLYDQNSKKAPLNKIADGFKYLILYFYPKDMTPGCTKEAEDFRDQMKNFEAKNAKIVGVSPDTVESHDNFAKKLGIDFPLLSDPQKKLALDFDVYKQKQFMGKKYMGIERATFLFENGKLKKSYQPVKVKNHIEDLLKELK